MIKINDVRTDIFRFLGYPSSSDTRIEVFLAIYEICSRNGLKRAPAKKITEIIAEILKDTAPDDEEEQTESGTRRENALYNKFQEHGLIRTITLYSEEQGKLCRYTCLTGMASKVYNFLRDISQTDLQETKDANIHAADINSKLLTDEKASALDHAYALESLQKSMFGLIEHLSGYNSAFIDYIDSLGSRLTNRNEFADALHDLFTSKFIREYSSLTNNAMPFRAAVNRTAKNIRAVLRNDEQFDRIVSARIEMYKTQGLKDIDRATVETETREIMLGVKSMCSKDYGLYVEQISERISEVIGRIKTVVDSFSADGRGLMRVKLMRLIRGCEENGIPVPDNLLDAYDCNYAGAWSLKPRVIVGQKEEESEDLNQYEETSETLSDDPQSDTMMEFRCLEFIERNFPLQKKISLKDVSCSTPEEFYFALSALSFACEKLEGLAILDEESSNEASRNKAGYLLPDIVIQRHI